MAITIPTADPRESGSAFMPELRQALNFVAGGIINVMGQPDIVGDGVTDDNAALQAIFDANPNATILFENADFVSDGSIILTDTTPRNFQGHILFRNATLTFTNDGLATDTDIACQRGFASYPKVNGSGGDSTGLGDGFVAEDLHIIGPAHGIGFYSANSSTASWLKGTYENNRYGLVLETSIGAIVDRITFQDNINAGLFLAFLNDTTRVWYGPTPESGYWNDSPTITNNKFTPGGHNIAGILDHGSNSQSIRTIDDSNIFVGGIYGYLARKADPTITNNWFEDVDYPVRLLTTNASLGAEVDITGITAAEPSGTYSRVNFANGNSVTCNVKGNMTTRAINDFNLQGVSSGTGFMGQNRSTGLTGNHLVLTESGGLIIDSGDTVAAGTYKSVTYPATYLKISELAPLVAPGLTGPVIITGATTIQGAAGGLIIKPRDGSGTDFTLYNPTGDDLQFDATALGTFLTLKTSGDMLRLTTATAGLTRGIIQNTATTGATTASGLYLNAYNGAAVANIGALLATANSWAYGTYVAKQLNLLGPSTGGLGLRTGTAPIAFYQGNADPDFSPEVARFTSGNLGIGTGATVSARIHSLSTTEQLRLGYDATNYASFTVGSSGLLAVDTSGGGVRFSDFGAGAARFDSLGNILSDGNGTLHSLSIAGSGTITPAVADLNFQSLSLTGALTGDRTLVWTVTDSPTLMFFHNLSTSSDGVPKALVIKTDAVGSVGSRLPQGFSGWFWHDGTNVYHRSHLMASRGSDVPPVELSGSTHTPPNGSVFIPGHVHVGVPGAGTNAPNVDRFVDGVAYIGLQAYEVYTGPLTDFSKVAGVFGYMVLDPSTDQPAGKEAYGVRGLLQVQTTSTKNFNQIFGTEGVALWGSSGDLDIGYGALGEFQFVGAGDVTDYCAGSYGIFKTFAGATGTAAAALGAVGSVRIDHAITVNFSRSLDALFVQSAGTITGNHVMIHSTTPQITGGTISGDLYGLRVEDTSSFGAFVGGEMFGIKVFGVNSQSVFECPVILGGSNVLTDVAPNLGIIKGQNAYAQATTNTTGGNILIAPGIGRRLYTVLDIASGDTTVTITVNGSAVALVGGVAGSGFLYGASTTIAATNLATAINANGTLNTKLKALASGASVYLTEKPPCYSLTIATNQATRISATSGTNGVIDARGHLGVGTGTFKAWASDQSAIQLGGVASFTAEKAAAAGSSFNLSNNAYYDGAWKYAVTDKAANYYQYNGTHNWRIAASGSADAAITWSNALKIDNTGNLKLAGTAVRATTEGTNHLDIFNGTAPAGALTNGVSLYAVGGKLFAMDSAGVATQLTP